MTTVAVVGGGYGGIAVAKALDDIADVTLIEPRDSFVHNIAALRAVVDPEWTERLFMPYDRLLTRGQVRRDRAVGVRENAVGLASGASITADYIVLATGSACPFPGKIDVSDRAGGIAKLRATQQTLGRAAQVLLLGAGPVGLEFAGEIKARWPEKAVTVVDPATELVSGRFPVEFRAELRAQLDAMGVELLLGTSLRELPTSAPFTVTTESGVKITADLWFRCHGMVPNSEYLGAGRRHIAVTPELRVSGYDSVFAVGDVTAVPEMKLARNAGLHAEVVATNIRTMIEGGDSLMAHQPTTDAIILPLGPKGGVLYTPEVGVLGAGPTADLKGDLFVGRLREALGAW